MDYKRLFEENTRSMVLRHINLSDRDALNRWDAGGFYESGSNLVFSVVENTGVIVSYDRPSDSYRISVNKGKIKEDFNGVHAQDIVRTIDGAINK